jgi:hypothetical protein
LSDFFQFPYLSFTPISVACRVQRKLLPKLFHQQPSQTPDGPDADDGD